MHARCPNPWINRRGESFELDDPNSFAREIWQTLSTAGFLHTTNVHEKA